MARKMMAEEAARAEGEYIQGVQATWQQQLIEHISRYWDRIPGLPNNLRCQVTITLLPSGQVIDVRVIQSSGSPAFDDSVRTAVLKASPLPLPADPKAFDRTLKPIFTPEMLQ